MATPQARVKNIADNLTDPKVLTADRITEIVEAYLLRHNPHLNLAAMTADRKARDFLNLLKRHIQESAVARDVATNTQAAAGAAYTAAKTKFDLGPDD